MGSMNFNFPVNPQLQAVAMAYRWPVGIADLVCPRVPVLAREFEWWLHNPYEELTTASTKIGRKSRLNEVDFGATKKTGGVEDFGLSSPLPYVDTLPGVKPAWYNLRGRKVSGIMKKIELEREKRVADLYFNAATYPSGNKQTLSGTSQFSHADSNPVKLVMDTMNDMIMKPNTFVFNETGWTSFRSNPRVTGALISPDNGNSPVVNATGKMASIQAVKDLFEIDNIFIGKSRINGSKPGQTASINRLWGNHLAMVYLDPDAFTPDAETITFGLTAQYGDRVAGSTPDPDMGLLGGERIKAGEMIKELIIAPDLGYLFSSVV
jgi:hypothetical protein